MPGCAVHLELARRMLDAWRGLPGDRPFPPDDPACRDAFLFGSLGPDLGYFPGGDALLADLAHCVRPSQLASHLIDSAETDLDRALAWGWVTHVLGDVWIHPLINQASGEHVRGRRLPGLTYADDPSTHIRIELGLDAILPASLAWADPRATGPFAPGGGAVELLTKAYRRTYGLSLSARRLRVAIRLSAGFVSILLLGGRIYSGRPAGPLAGLAYGGAASLTRRLRPGGPIAAFTNPLPPPDWLIAEVGAVVEGFAGKFQPYYASGFSDVPDYNLDTGQVESDLSPYPLTVAALAELDRRRPAKS